MTRQTVIAENVANADTPGYRAQDVDSFAKAIEGQRHTFIARRTGSERYPFRSEANGFGVHDDEFWGPRRRTATQVSLEDQMMRAADVKQTMSSLGVCQVARRSCAPRSARGKTSHDELTGPWPLRQRDARQSARVRLSSRTSPTPTRWLSAQARLVRAGLCRAGRAGDRQGRTDAARPESERRSTIRQPARRQERLLSGARMSI